jgi:hypothetical protein
MATPAFCTVSSGTFAAVLSALVPVDVVAGPVV